MGFGIWDFLPPSLHPLLQLIPLALRRPLFAVIVWILMLAAPVRLVVLVLSLVAIVILRALLLGHCVNHPSRRIRQMQYREIVRRVRLTGPATAPTFLCLTLQRNRTLPIVLSRCANAAAAALPRGVRV